MQQSLSRWAVSVSLVAALASAFSFVPLLSLAQVVSDPTYPKPLDTWPGATAAYSFRKLRTGYTGAAMQVRRSSDNATQDIGFTSNGNFDAAAFNAFVGSGTGYVNRWYDQPGNGNDLTQPTASKQWRVVLGGSPSGQPVARCATVKPCGMTAADSASYKTSNIETFNVVKIGIENATNQEANRWIVGYPQSSATIETYPPANVSWAFANMFNMDLMLATGFNWLRNLEGFGAVYRNQLFQYDADTQTGTIQYNGTQWEKFGGFGTITYPSPMGLYVGMAADGKGSIQGDFAEIMLYGATQSARDSISANQSSYWGIVNPPTTVTTADGQTWAPIYTGDFGCSSSGGPLCGKTETVNGRRYFTESSWDSYSVWRGTNVSTGRDLTRFEAHYWDVDDTTGAERTEFDGSADPLSSLDQTVQISYAMQVEPGSALTSVAWDALGQYHYADNATVPASFAFQFQNEKLRIDVDGTSGVYTSPTMIRGQWYNMFVEQRISSSKTNDELKVWMNGQLVVNLFGSVFRHNAGQGGYWKYGIYRGWHIPQAMAVRYANMEVTDKAVNDITSRITSPLSVTGGSTVSPPPTR